MFGADDRDRRLCSEPIWALLSEPFMPVSHLGLEAASKSAAVGALSVPEYPNSEAAHGCEVVSPFCHRRRRIAGNRRKSNVSHTTALSSFVVVDFSGKLVRPFRETGSATKRHLPPVIALRISNRRDATMLEPSVHLQRISVVATFYEVPPRRFRR